MWQCPQIIQCGTVFKLTNQAKYIFQICLHGLLKNFKVLGRNNAYLFVFRPSSESNFS